MAKAAILIVLFAASALPAVTFDVARFAGQDELAPAEFDIKPPWGLWANRAPYPYYDGPVGIDVLAAQWHAPPVDA